MTESDVMSLAELQAQFEDSQRALAGKASVAELAAAHEASVAVTT